VSAFARPCMVPLGKTMKNARADTLTTVDPPAAVMAHSFATPASRPTLLPTSFNASVHSRIEGGRRDEGPIHESFPQPSK